MPLSNTLRRIVPLLLCASALPALASNLTGTVTNRTNGKPSAGDEVVLIRLQQTMQETTRTKTDARGHFTLEIPDAGMHLVRVTHEKASYFQPVQPGTDSVTLDVYDAAPKIDNVTTAVEELHVEATATELHIVEVLQVINNSQPARTQFGPAGFDFYVPAAAHIVRAGAQRDGMPVPTSATPVGDPGHYTFLFPIRPGETQFGIFYTMPYVGQQTFDLRLATPVSTAAIVMPRSMTFKAGPASPWQVSREQGQDPATQTWVMQNVSLAQPLQFTVSGTGNIPDQRSGGQNGAQEGAAQGGTSPSGQPLPETQNTAPGRGLQNPARPRRRARSLGQVQVVDPRPARPVAGGLGRRACFASRKRRPERPDLSRRFRRNPQQATAHPQCGTRRWRPSRTNSSRSKPTTSSSVYPNPNTWSTRQRWSLFCAEPLARHNAPAKPAEACEEVTR